MLYVNYNSKTNLRNKNKGHFDYTWERSICKPQRICQTGEDERTLLIYRNTLGSQVPRSTIVYIHLPPINASRSLAQVLYPACKATTVCSGHEASTCPNHGQLACHRDARATCPGTPQLVSALDSASWLAKMPLESHTLGYHTCHPPKTQSDGRPGHPSHCKGLFQLQQPSRTTQYMQSTQRLLLHKTTPLRSRKEAVSFDS